MWPERKLRDARKPVLFFHTGLGDHLLSLPAIRALAHIYGERLTIIGRQGMPQWFYHELPVGRCIEVEMQNRDGTGYWFDLEGAVAEVGECDVFTTLITWHTSQVDELARRLGAQATVGFAHGGFDYPRAYEWEQHSADLAFEVPACIDPSLSIEQFAQAPRFHPRFVEKAAQIRALLPRDYRLLAVHTETLPKKEWPIERFAAVIDEFLDRFPDFLVVTVDVEERELACGRHADRVVPACGLYLPTAAHLISQCDLFLGVDSCFLHAADLYRVPGVTLFGPTQADEWGYRFGRGCAIQAAEMVDISVERVLDGLVKMATAPERWAA